MVLNEYYRYFRYIDGSEELYDGVTDPKVWTNLTDKPELVGVKTELVRLASIFFIEAIRRSRRATRGGPTI